MPRVVHFEIHADEPQRAARFYTELFGWSIRKWEGEADYWMITTGSSDDPGINGGLMPRRGPTPVEGQPTNAFVCTVSVNNLDLFTARAAQVGGEVVVPKFPIPGVGWLAYAKDTEGNIFGLMQMDESAR